MTKIAVVTGGSSGIGKRIAERLLADEWFVWNLDISPEGLNNSEDYSGRYWHRQCDVSNLDSVRGAFEFIQSITPSIDALVCSAGVIRPALLVDNTPEDMDLLFDVNVKGAWLSIREAIPALSVNASTNDPSRIVIIGSVAGMSPKVGSGLYAATKAAVHAMASVLAVELGPSGITVNVIAPGTVMTPMFEQVVAVSGTTGYRPYGNSPLGRMAQTDDVANAVLYLVGNTAKFINGAVLPVDGGTRAALPKT